MKRMRSTMGPPYTFPEAINRISSIYDNSSRASRRIPDPPVLFHPPPRCYRSGMTRPAPSSVERLAEEYRALRDAAAAVDLERWTVLRLTGSETREFLQGTATQDFDTPPAPGVALRTLFLTEKGRPVAHAWI